MASGPAGLGRVRRALLGLVGVVAWSALAGCLATRSDLEPLRREHRQVLERLEGDRRGRLELLLQLQELDERLRRIEGTLARLEARLEAPEPEPAVERFPAPGVAARPVSAPEDLYLAARRAWRSGNPARARALLEGALAVTGSQTWRSEAEWLLGRVYADLGDPYAALETWLGLLERLPPRDPVRVRAQLGVAELLGELGEVTQAVALLGGPEPATTVSDRIREAWTRLWHRLTGPEPTTDASGAATVTAPPTAPLPLAVPVGPERVTTAVPVTQAAPQVVTGR